MKNSAAAWVNTLSALIFLSLIGFFLSEIPGQFFSALAAGTDAELDKSFQFLGRAFGFFLFVLLGVGAVLVPGELLGFIRLYKRVAEGVDNQRSLVRTILLVSMAVLSIAAVVLLAMIVSRLAK